MEVPLPSVIPWSQRSQNSDDPDLRIEKKRGGIGVASICGGLAQGDGVVVQVGGDSAE